MNKQGRPTMYDQRRVAEAAVVPGTRLPPPTELNPAEAKTWREITGRLPEDWFTAENTPLLKELCRHIGHADALSLDIEAIRAELANLAKFEIEELSIAGMSDADRRKALRAATSDYHALLRLHAFQSERIGNLATKLRLSQQARIYERSAPRKADRTPAGPKPWMDWHDLGNQPSEGIRPAN